MPQLVFAYSSLKLWCDFGMGNYRMTLPIHEMRPPHFSNSAGYQLLRRSNRGTMSSHGLWLMSLCATQSPEVESPRGRIKCNKVVPLQSFYQRQSIAGLVTICWSCSLAPHQAKLLSGRLGLEQHIVRTPIFVSWGLGMACCRRAHPCHNLVEHQGNWDTIKYY